MCTLVAFPKNSFTPTAGIKLFGSQHLAIKGGGGVVSKFKDDGIFVIFREFNILLEITDLHADFYRSSSVSSKVEYTICGCN